MKYSRRWHIRILVTATDVLHSWAIPSLGVKIDACPGRLNQTSVFIANKNSGLPKIKSIEGLKALIRK